MAKVTKEKVLTAALDMFSQKGNVKRDNRILIDFWDQAFTLSEEQKAQLRNQQEDWKKLAPSEKLFQAAFSLGERKNVLDYGCGSAWAAIIAAKGRPFASTIRQRKTARKAGETVSLPPQER